MSPGYLPRLTRAQLCGRIWALRRALDELQIQAEADGHGAIPGYGALKVALIGYEGQLRAADGPVPAESFAAAVNSHIAEQRLRAAGADLAETVRELAMDGARALSNISARHRALALAETAPSVQPAERGVA